jgi:SAM-dependent methyltransferase
MWLPRFECPDCRAPVSPVSPDSSDSSHGDGGFVCSRCGQTFAWRAGAYRFLTPRRAEASAAFLRQYRLVREREGRRSLGAERRRALPDVEPCDPHAAEWRLRRQSYARLLRHALPDQRRSIRVVDLGAGCGWLSHRLTAFGHAVVAVDELDDEADGLSACRDYPVPFAAVQADFDCLPFEPSQFDLAVFDGSLHYSPDPLATLAEAKRTLATGGALAVLDSPMFLREDDGEHMVADTLRQLKAEHGLSSVIRPGVGFLTFDTLDRAAKRLDLRGHFVPSRGPLSWRVRRSVARVRLNRAPAAFGVWVAR